MGSALSWLRAPPTAEAPLAREAAPCASEEESVRFARLADAVRTIIECVGEDPLREGLVKTPRRMARALLDCTAGYKQDLETVISGAIFDENHNEMVIVKDIPFFSFCEHHILPFMGKIHIAYIPRGKVLGLSKLARISEMYCRRLQVQERLTREIATGITHAVDPMGVAVVIEATHLCMCMRGVQKPGSLTVTSSVTGCFRRDLRTRSEFFAALNLTKL